MLSRLQSAGPRQPKSACDFICQDFSNGPARRRLRVGTKFVHCVRSIVYGPVGHRIFLIMSSRSGTHMLNPRGGDFAQHGKPVIFLSMT
ncbi:hypothetical protein D4A92_21880 (plasmid) [Rhizobium rosettiformans]|uniref:Uncharacterized protein n=1 Tax=Rhizobium rosettiformans TaxID=1368430 RepID=A0ABX7F0U5_9HYPH|nr:hypothetical protein D4A92_21880 [Rhizobium rosettiformans]